MSISYPLSCGKIFVISCILHFEKYYFVYYYVSINVSLYILLFFNILSFRKVYFRSAYHRTYHSAEHISLRISFFWEFLDVHIILPRSCISLRWISLKFRLVPVCTNWSQVFISNFDYLKLI